MDDFGDITLLAHGEALDTKHFVGKPLVIGKRVGAIIVQCAQGPQIRRGHDQLLAEM